MYEGDEEGKVPDAVERERVKGGEQVYATVYKFESFIQCSMYSCLIRAPTTLSLHDDTQTLGCLSLCCTRSYFQDGCQSGSMLLISHWFRIRASRHPC